MLHFGFVGKGADALVLPHWIFFLAKVKVFLEFKQMLKNHSLPISLLLQNSRCPSAIARFQRLHRRVKVPPSLPAFGRSGDLY